MAKTRSTKAAVGKKQEDTRSTTCTTRSLESPVDNPPHIVVLPQNLSSDARIATLPHPVTDAPSRYLVCPSTGFYEFTRVAAPKQQKRSWLIAPSGSGELEQHAESDVKHAGYVLETPDLLVATPVDPLFILLPALAGDVESLGHEYLAASDYLVKLTNKSGQMASLLRPNQPRELEITMESRMEAVCDCMDMGEERMYALSLPKLVKELVAKARKMIARGLPPSMENKFVKQALDVPVLSIKREESSISIATDDATPGAESQRTSGSESQGTDASGLKTLSASTAATSLSVAPIQDPMTAPECIADLLRLRVAVTFMLSSYISLRVHAKIEALLKDESITSINFAPLDQHLEHVASLKKEALALRSLSDNISRKRSTIEDEDALDKAEVKKRKKEEEENRKKNTSHGVKQLAKVNTKGMQKMSSFFTKMPAKK